MIKHISLDVWGTLITPNNEYAEARNNFLAKYFHIKVSDVETIYAKAKSDIDNGKCIYGKAPSTNECIMYFADLLSEYKLTIKGVFVNHVKEIRWEITQLFLKYPPKSSDYLRDALFGATNKFTISILSNTNFISGYTLYPYLYNIYDEVFDFAYFSDIEGIAKPDKQFFEGVIQKSGKPPDEIIHIGDSNYHDSGAINCGMHFCRVRNPIDTAKVIHMLMRGYYKDIS